MLTIRAVTRLIGLGTSVRITNYKPLSVRDHQQPMTSSYNLEFSPRKVIFFFDLFSLNLRGEHTKDIFYTLNSVPTNLSIQVQLVLVILVNFSFWTRTEQTRVLN